MKMRVCAVLCVASLLVDHASARNLLPFSVLPNGHNEYSSKLYPPRQGRKLSGEEVESKQHRKLNILEQLQPPPQHDVDNGPFSGTSNSTTFDFVVAGFPKCGTTTLLKTFEAHNETAMSSKEECVVASSGKSDISIKRIMGDLMTELDPSHEMVRSFKCPTAIYNFKSIARIHKYFPEAKYVIGMRHPIKMLQSFYNYRITEIHTRNLQQEIPSLHDIVSSGKPWKGVSPDAARFELFLMQLGKAAVSPELMFELSQVPYELAIKPTGASVFVYTMDQMEDSDVERSDNFRSVLQNFLGLQTPIPPFGHENKNHLVGSSGFEESIDICDDEFSAIRHNVVVNARKTVIWLRDHFVEGRGVTVANKEHFIESLESWGVDFCHQSPITSKT